MLLPKSITTLREGYSRSIFFGDLFAGVTVAIVALPLALALAIASGVTPDRGLYTAIVAGFLISALGGSRVAIGGPTGAFVVIVYHIVERHGYEGLAIATLMAGVFLILMGLGGVGNLIKFIPYPVTTGFTAGIAVIIFSTQIKDFFGLRIEKVPGDVVEKWRAYFDAAFSWNPHATAVGVGSLMLIVLLRKATPKIPGAIVAVIAAAAAVKFLDLPVDTIGSVFGGIPHTLPAPSLPSFDFSRARDLVPDAVTIALLCAIESLLCAVVADGMTGYRHRSNVELVAQGIANLGSVVFGGIPATGAIARTTVNVKTGGTTPVAGMIHAVMLLLMMLALAPLASLIPLATLAAILILVAWSMSEIDRFRHLLKAPRSDVMVLLTTFILTVVVDLTAAVQIGMVLAAFLFMRRMSEVTNISRLTLDYGEENESTAVSPLQRTLSGKILPRGVEIYEINGPFFFGVVDRLFEILKQRQKIPRAFILQMRNVTAIDATGLHALEQFVKKCERQKIALITSGLHAQPLTAIRKIDLDDVIGEENLCGDLDEAMERAVAIVHE